MEAVARLAGLLEPPQPKYIHIAGTNGKGSTTAFVQSILVSQGWKTGGYFSPYVIDPRERIQVNKHLISQQDFARVATELLEVDEKIQAEGYGGISEFEYKTAMALLYWRQQKCEWVALEVGLGGRLDATNIVTPQCSVIVSIGLDHQNILGSTIEEIAAEKAGIIKHGVPLVLGQVPDAAREVILGIAAQKGAPVYEYGRHFAWLSSGTLTFGDYKWENIVPGIPGQVQHHNLALAIAACHLSGGLRQPEHVPAGAKSATIPGRLQEVLYNGQRYLVDGAHNADSAKILAEHLKENFDGPLTFVTGMVQGHDPKPFYKELASFIKVAHVTRIDSPRSMDPQLLQTELDQLGILNVGLSGCEGLRGLKDDDPIVVTGSFYLAGEVLRLFREFS